MRILHDKTVLFPLLLCDDVGVTLSHLSCQVFKHFVDVPALLRRGLVKREFPARHEFLNRTTCDLTLVILQAKFSVQ